MNAELTRKLMRVCALRLDSTVSAEDFVTEVQELVDQVYDAAVSIDDRQDELPFAGADASSDTPASPAALTDSAKPLASKATPRGRRLSYDEKVRIRQRYEAACADRQRAPRGWFEDLSSEMHVPVSTLKAVIYRQDGT